MSLRALSDTWLGVCPLDLDTSTRTEEVSTSTEDVDLGVAKTKLDISGPAPIELTNESKGSLEEAREPETVGLHSLGYGESWRALLCCRLKMKIGLHRQKMQDTEGYYNETSHLWLCVFVYVCMRTRVCVHTHTCTYV